MIKLALVVLITTLIVVFSAIGSYYGYNWRQALETKATLSSRLSQLNNSLNRIIATYPKPDQPTASLNSSRPLHFLISYTNFGFMPNIASVPVGTVVEIKNLTNEGGMGFYQDPSQSIANNELNLGVIEMNQEKSMTLTKKGTWIYLNSWETTDKGQITVQ
jgi:hypothetical protein